MTLDFFMNNYNLLDFKINKAKLIDYKLYLDINYDVYLELIANGYRPEMNMDLDKTFIFNVNHPDHKFKTNNVKLINENNNFYILIDNDRIQLEGEVVCL